MLANKDWDSIAKAMYNNAELVNTDPVFAQAIRLFEAEFFVVTDPLPDKDKLKVYEYPSLIIDLNRHKFSTDFVNTFVEKKLRLLRETKSDKLLSYASSYQHHPLAVQFLNEIQSEEPTRFADARRQDVSIKSTSTHEGEKKTTSLFKSRQEQLFFEAVREAFPTYHPYPNVAVSCIIDYSKIKEYLGAMEREYFFKAIVDCVVFDTGNGYEPKYFIELDSTYHDNPRAVKNDQMKKAIFEAANTELIRVRAHNQTEVTKDKFKQLVIELMRGL